MFCILRIMITETWLHSNINSGLLDPRQQYHITRKDRFGSQHGGGVAIFVKRDISLIDVAIDDEFTSLELLCIDLSLETCILRFFVVYRAFTGRLILINVLLYIQTYWFRA